MTTSQILSRTAKGTPPPLVLLLGQEAYQRRRIKDALMAAFPADAMTQHDLQERSLAEVLDDARSLSLFASERLIWVANAEAVLPRGRAAEDAESESTAPGDQAPLAEYAKDPTPGIVMVFEASRFDFEGDDKRKQERVRKFFASVPDVVELRRFSAYDATSEAQALVSRAGFSIEPDALELLVEALGADVSRIAVEIEKLSLYASGRSIKAEDIAELVPDARATNVFALVGALGRRDRVRALELLDTLAREGEYLPLALAFLGTQFRLALAASEAGLKSAQQISSHFGRIGIQLWGNRAEQIQQTVTKFSRAQLERSLRLIYATDRGLRDARPDDRIVMEKFVLELTA
jgi:DNA polymerase-3 subunit delta